MGFFERFKKDAKSCFRGARKSATDSPFGTTKTFIMPDPASMTILAADAVFSCGKNVYRRRNIESDACKAQKRNDSKKLDELSKRYNFEGFGSKREMLSTCTR